MFLRRLKHLWMSMLPVLLLVACGGIYDDRELACGRQIKELS
jgi:hypothetical protein